MREKWRYIASHPELLFLLFAVPYGLILALLIPPLGGGDEGFHYHRIASIAYFQLLNKPVMVPSGIVSFIQSGLDFFHSGLEPPFHYSAAEWHKVHSMLLDTGELAVMEPNPATIHHPFSYLPQVILFMLASEAHCSPLGLLYLARFAGLAAGISLTYMAIKRMPSHKYFLCLIALLPTVTFYRSYINADAFTIGLAFLFLAILFREIAGNEKISDRNIAVIAILSFILAQSKSAYLLLSLLAFAIPGNRFSSPVSRIISLAIIILPGMLASVAWMVVMKQTYFAGIRYHTWGGDVNPDMQSAFILHHPFEYTKILLRTLFFTFTLPLAFTSIVNDVGPGYFMPLPVTILLIYFMVKGISCDREINIDYGKTARLIALAAFAGITVISFTILYIQWTGLKAPEIQGFQGRYFYPLLPLITFFLKPSKEVTSQKAASYIALLAFLGLSASLVRIYLNYY